MTGCLTHQRIQGGIASKLGQSRIKAAYVVDQHADSAEVADVATDALQLVKDGGVLRALEGYSG